MILVDSDIMIEASRGRDLALLKVWNDLSEGAENVAYSPVSVAELWHGARHNEIESLDHLFGALTCLTIDDAIGRVAGQYLSKYRRSHGLLIGDAFVAATAHVYAARLWTRNRKHFPMAELSFFQG